MRGYRACTRAVDNCDGKPAGSALMYTHPVECVAIEHARMQQRTVTTNPQLQHLATCWHLPAFPSLPVIGLNRVTRGTSNSGRDGAGGFSLMSLTLRPLWQSPVLTALERKNVWSLSAWVEGASAGPMTLSHPWARSYLPR